MFGFAVIEANAGEMVHRVVLRIAIFLLILDMPVNVKAKEIEILAFLSMRRLLVDNTGTIP